MAKICSPTPALTDIQRSQKSAPLKIQSRMDSIKVAPGWAGERGSERGGEAGQNLSPVEWQLI